MVVLVILVVVMFLCICVYVKKLCTKIFMCALVRFTYVLCVYIVQSCARCIFCLRCVCARVFSRARTDTNPHKMADIIDEYFACDSMATLLASIEAKLSEDERLCNMTPVGQYVCVCIAMRDPVCVLF